MRAFASRLQLSWLCRIKMMISLFSKFPLKSSKNPVFCVRLVFLMTRGLIYINHIKITATGKYKVAMKFVKRR